MMLATALAACDPCGFTVSCGRSPEMAVVGQIVDRTSGVPRGGSVITATYDSGVMINPPSLRTVSRSDGYFELSAPSAAVGTTWLTFTVATPGQREYVVSDVRVVALTTTGDATVLDPWVSERPDIPFAIRVEQQGTHDAVGGATVTFQRTGGRRLLIDGVEVTTISRQTGAEGILFLFDSASSDTTGDIRGTVTITRDPGVPAVTFPGVTVAARPRYRTPHTTITLAVP